jgi:hypothetical protein
MKRRSSCFCLMLAGSLAWLTTGCGGFSGSHSISPATFLLPGLGQVTPKPVLAPETVVPLTPAEPGVSSVS